MKKILKLLMLFALGAGAAACNDDKPEEIPYENDADSRIWFYSGTISVTNPGDGSVFTEKGIVFKLVVNEDKNICNLVMYDAVFDQKMPTAFDITVSGLSARQSGGGYYITGDEIIPTYGNGSPMPTWTMTDIVVIAETKTLSVTMECGDYPLTYSGKAYEPGQNEFGKEGESFEDLTPTPIPGESYRGLFEVESSTGPHILENVKVDVTFSSDMKTCSIMLNQVTFSSRMPDPVDVLIPGVACKAEGEGYLLELEEITVGGFTITGLEGEVSDDTLDLSFTCAGSPVTYSGTAIEVQ